MRNWNAMPKQAVNLKIRHALYERARSANINFSKALEQALLNELGRATDSEIINGARKLIRSVQDTGIQQENLPPQYIETLAGVLKILALLETETPVSKPQLDDLVFGFLPANSDILRAHALGTEETDVLNAAVNSEKNTDEKPSETES